ncbi:hypothetical protein [Micromonospora sp. RTP1Z1]|uniref:hypothetical protein n=1 Tax=Micromonospora sp. RTP1Z1 TaxID=2994043 RepID=UPI0029C7859F|nr:hypothetical protein [Micromonospora sp. RTP1Z1]
MPDLLQFVDAIGGSPTVRLDLNDDATWSVQYEGTDFSPPQLRQAWASTLLADGEQLAAAAYGNRTIRLRLDLQTASLDAAWTQLQALHRELDRESNLLRWRPQGTTNPVFFRTIRSMANRVTEFPGPGLLRTVDVEIEAEPFALGLKETLGPFTVTNNPAAGSNGMYLDLTGVKGDVETPLKITIPYSGTATTWMFAVRRRGTPGSSPFVLQCESMTQGSDTSTQPNDAAMSGAGNNFSRTSFATNAAMAQRLSTSWPPPGVDVRGRYRVFVLVRRSSGTGAINAKLGWGPKGGTASVFGAPASAATINSAFFDLGLVSYPGGTDPVADGYSGTALSVLDQTVAIWAERISGTSTIDWDYLLFVPADDRLTFVTRPLSITDYVSTPNGEKVVVDGATESLYALWGTGEIIGGWAGPTISGKLVGGWPAASPGVTNRLYAVQTGVPVSPATTAQVTIEYWPRYLYARPASS